jgi:hypothetical protein
MRARLSYAMYDDIELVATSAYFHQGDRSSDDDDRIEANFVYQKCLDDTLTNIYKDCSGRVFIPRCQ